MRLQKIKLSGFKSFVDSTIIEVNGSLVGIVGPNGCGKSNVIDAVRWVLGESSAKQLRGEAMQDVIFNGSIKRKPVSRASVELMFDNSSHILSGAFGTYEEVSIKRVLTRMGESSYYINNQVVRRKDITELFLGTGVGAKGYAIIEQGMISRIIDAKPEELRFYLEEAASVSKYREKRKETITKLDDTKDNLTRITDINQELEKQIDALTIQARDAKKYQDLKVALDKEHISLLSVKIAKSQHSLDNINLEFDKINQEVESNETTIGEINKNLAIKLELKTNKDNQLSKQVESFNLLRTKVARLEERFEHNQNLKIRLANERNQLLEDIANCNLAITDEQEQLIHIEDIIATNTITIEEYELTRDDKTNTFNLVEGEYNKYNDTVIDWLNSIKDKQHELELTKNKQDYKNQQLLILSNRLKKLEGEKSENLLDFNQIYTEITTEISKLALEISHIEDELTLANDVKKDVTQNIEGLTKEYNELSAQISSSASKLAMYTELLAKNSINTELSKYIETANQSLEPLWHELVVLQGYELAVETVLGDILNAVELSSLDGIKEVPPQKLSLWISTANNYELNYTHKINNHLNFDTLDKFVTVKNPAYNTVYKILSTYVVVDNIEVARFFLSNLPIGYNIVTKNGHLLNHNYVIFNANSEANRTLEYQNKILELDNELKILNTRKNKLEINLTDNKQAYIKYEHNVKRLDELYKTNLAKKHQLELKLTKEEQIFTQNKVFQEKVAKEYNLLMQEITYCNGEINELKLQIEDIQIEIEFLNEKLELARTTKADFEVQYNLAKVGLDELNQKINKLVVDNQLLIQKKHNLLKAVEERVDQKETFAKKIIFVEEESKSIVISEENEELAILKDELVSNAQTIEEYNNELTQINQIISKIRDDLNLLNQAKEKIIIATNQLSLKKQEQELQIKSLQDKLSEYTLLQDEEPFINKDNLSQYSIKTIEETIKQLELEINTLGLVNLKAIEDLDECTNKHNEVVTRIKDLNDAIATLLDAIKKIDNETRNLLNDTYIKVNQAFVTYFKTLFGGGGANLELTDKDILNAGLQIFAQPPGKKNSTIQLLSGGEKALTAMSLVFAFFNLNPAPFCLLDEVDAPLDDANTSRFCNLVQKLAGNTQFIYISHNRLTMEMADQLVGVTMQEKGVSTIVSVSLVDAVKHAV